MTGTIDNNTTLDKADNRTHSPRFNPENLTTNQALVELMGTLAAQKHATPAQIALAWVFAQKPWIVPISGTRRLDRLEENLGAARVTLVPEELRSLNGVLSSITISGDRYPSIVAGKLGK